MDEMGKMFALFAAVISYLVRWMDEVELSVDKV